jgi:uncharacterized membrane protein (GlpM family)
VAPPRPPRRRWKLAGYLALFALFAVNAALSASRERAHEAARLREASEIKALIAWAVLRAERR